MKMLIRCIILIVHLSVSLISVNAQTTSIKGKVIDAKSKQSIPGVIIYSQSNKIFFSDSKGNFQLDINKADSIIKFSSIGYEDFIYKFSMGGSDISNSLEKIEILLEASYLNLDAVVISAGKSNQRISDVTVSIESIKAILIERTNTTRIENVIDQIPGVNIVNGQANIRGGSGFSYGAGSRVLVMVDGLPYLSGDAADVKWDAIPVENISQVEVIKGASSALFGSGALGGIINIRTVKPTNKPVFKARIFSGIYDQPKDTAYRFRNYDAVNYGSSLFYSRKISKLDISAGVFYLKDDGYREGEIIENRRANINLAWNFSERFSIGVNTNFVKIDQGNFLFWKDTSDALIPAKNTLQLANNKRISIDPFILYESKNGLKQSIRGRYYLTANSNSTNQNSDAHFYYSEYQLQQQIKLTEDIVFTGTAGAAGTYTKVFSDSLYGDHEADNLALFGQIEQKIKRVNISFGLRFERNRMDTLKAEYFPVFRGGFSFKIGKAGFLRASLGQGYRFPSIAERFTQTASGGLRVFPNPKLKSESGYSAEIGFRQGFKISSWKGYADVAGFWTEYQNMMEFTFGLYLPPGPPPIITIPYLGFSAINITNAKINGIDASIGGQGTLWKFPLQILAGYTFINPVNKDYIKKPADTLGTEHLLKYRFQHTAKINADLSIWKFEVGATTRYTSFMVNIDPILSTIIPGLNGYRKFHNKGYWIHDLRLGYNISGSQKFSFIIKNALNTEYMFFPGNIGAMRTFNVQYLISL